MNTAHYAEFQLQDFLEDDFFIKWVIAPGENDTVFWESFVVSYPHKKEIVNQAAAIVKHYREQEFFDNEKNKEAVWNRITQSAEQSHSNSAKRIFRLPVFRRVAAAAVLIIVTGVLFLLTRKSGNELYTIATVSGQIKTITLPDNSIVTLNGNSALSYKDNWDSKTPREVWIKGEGYFNVRHLNKDTLHISPSERFVVHCEDVNIEVLGTTFNVKNRSGKTNVALITGKIRIDGVEKTSSVKPLVLAPGDYVEYANKKLVAAKKLVKPAQIVSWTTDDDISFTDATIKDIKETLEDRFGYTVNIEDTTLLNLKIEGDISVNNVADLLDVVTTTLNIKVEQSANKHIAISK